MRAVASLLVLLLAGTAAAEDEEASYPSWDWGGSVSVLGGYDDNISVSSLVRPGEKQGSATTDFTGKIGPELSINALLSSALVYTFNQVLYYSSSELDEQSHKLALSASLQHDRVEASLGYSFGLTALIPNGSLYSLDHQPSLSVEVLLRQPLWFGVDYALHHYDLRDETYAYLGGQRHTIDAYPEIYLARKLLLYGGYRLELLRIGSTVEELTGPMGTVQVTSPQSYDGHYFFLYLRWRPVPALALGLSGRVGRRFYQPLITSGATGGSGPGPGGGGGGSGGGGIERRDTIVTVEPEVSWRFWKGLSLKASFYYEKSSSSVTTRRVLSSSYDNLAGAGGVRWDF